MDVFKVALRKIMASNTDFRTKESVEINKLCLPEDARKSKLNPK